MEVWCHLSKINKTWQFLFWFLTRLYLLSSNLLSLSDPWPHDGPLGFPLRFSSWWPSACLRLKETPKSSAALWECFVLERHSFWPFYPRRIAPFLRPCWKSMQLFWWPFQTEEKDKCRICCSYHPLGLDRLDDALYWTVSPALSTSSVYFFLFVTHRFSILVFLSFLMLSFSCFSPFCFIFFLHSSLTRDIGLWCHCTSDLRS